MRAGFLLVFLALSGCAGWSERACRAGDWAGQGERDGAAGHASSRLQKHQESCAAHGIIPDPQAYEAGHAKGLLRYCQPEGVFEQARHGSRLQPVCPAENQTALREAQQRGENLYRVEADLAQLQHWISRLELDLNRSNLTDTERQQRRIELSRLYREENRLSLLVFRMETAFRQGRPEPPYFGRSLLY